MKEIWKDVVGYEGLYQVSNLGNVRNKKTKKHLYKNCNNVNNYLFVNLGRKNKKYIHRLVYETFKGFKNKNSIINHINGDKRDNGLNNLEECNYSYNLIYAYYHGERKLNCYVVNIPKEVVEKTNLKDVDLKISSKDNKIIIEKWEKGE